MGIHLVDWLRRLGADLSAAHRQKAAALTVFELEELENVFALLLAGSFVGMPAPPSFIAVELLPLLEEELAVMDRRAEDSEDMLAEMVGTLGLD